jgi:hypothetical protein
MAIRDTQKTSEPKEKSTSDNLSDFTFISVPPFTNLPNLIS